MVEIITMISISVFYICILCAWLLVNRKLKIDSAKIEKRGEDLREELRGHHEKAREMDMELVRHVKKYTSLVHDLEDRVKKLERGFE